MAYKDPDKQRQAKRESARRARAAKRGTPVEPLVPAPLRLQTAQDVLELLQEQVVQVRDDETLKSTDRARTVGYLASIALRAVETAYMAARIEALEAALKRRPQPAKGPGHETHAA